MSFFNGFDMADFDAYDAGYSHSRRRIRSTFDYMKTRRGQREAHIARNVREGVWFTGVKLSDMTDEHLANALALCKRKSYDGYIPAIDAEQQRRKAAKR